jgi:TetR/AcrR family transcriptional repressor of bet genes
MARRPGRPSNTQERRAQIVAAFGRVLAAQGYQGATIAAIGREAKLAPGLVHYHFESKREVLLALVAAVVDTLRRRADERLAQAGTDPRKQLDAVIDAHLEADSSSEPGVVRAWAAIGAEALGDAWVREQYAQALSAAQTQLEEKVRRCLKAERRSTSGAQKIAAALLSAIEGAYRIGAAAPELLPPGFAAPMVRRMAQGLIDSA